MYSLYPVVSLREFTLVDEHTPRKTRKPVNKTVPFMNSELRKMTHSKSMARNKFFKYGRTQKLWDSYRKIRNISTKVETASMRKYFADKCNTVKQTGRTNKFGDTIKPFVTNKVKYYGDVISLKVNDSIVNDPLLVCSITETEMSSFWRNLHHWLHRKLSKWQLSVQPVMKISSKWLHFRFSDI